MSPNDAVNERSTVSRYIQLTVLILAAGAIYPLVYLRQNFEVSILESFGITNTELGQCYAMLGIIFVVTYLPSGWLADKVMPRWLLAFSLAATGLLGIWFSTMPSFESLLVIFAGWGIVTGLTFWAALIKGVAVLARHDEQGRFFGLLDGGRGLVEAILATIAVAWFAYSLDTLGQSTSDALLKVIYLYVGYALLLAPIVVFAVDDVKDDAATADSTTGDSSLLADLKLILGKAEVWLAAFCILTGYQLFWATYSFSAYMQQNYGLTAVAVGSITVAKLWMRPIGAVAAGFIGDRLNRERVLAFLMLSGTVALAGLIALPLTASVSMLLAVVLFIGLATYAIRGIFWATLDSCEIPIRIKGLAIGVISLIGYSPDIYLPLLNGFLLDKYPGKPGYSIYFGGIVFMGLLGTLSAWRLNVIVTRREARAI
ncbi:MAG: MFS transporter [Gammaproteobacteria bacterium]|jgi:sugar phosphate permease|nr:MFS transporter [Gammaproteobacteria bacterium]